MTSTAARSSSRVAPHRGRRSPLRTSAFPMDARLQEPESTEKSLSHSLMTAFEETPDSVFGEAIERHIKNGLLKEEGDALFLTSKGTDLANYVMSDFILDENNR